MIFLNFFDLCSPRRVTNGLKSTTSGRSPLKPLNNTVTSNGKNEKLDDLAVQIEGLKLSIDGLEKERDFYFGKLRDIEVMII